MLQHLLVIGSFLLICGILHWGMKKMPAKTIEEELVQEEPIKEAI